MPNYNMLLSLIKKAAAEAVSASNPVAVCFGKVESISPLRIKIDQKIALGENQLIIVKRIKENPLLDGDTAVLLRVQGGQKYIVMDRT